MGGVKICKDCRFCDAPHTSGAFYCCHSAFGKPEIDIVTGESRHSAHRFCRDVRADEALCGEQGKWFEPKA